MTDKNNVKTLLKVATKTNDPERDKALILLLGTALAEKKMLHRKGTDAYYHVARNNNSIDVHPDGGGFTIDLAKMNPDHFELVDEMPSEFQKCVLTLDGVPEFTAEGYCIPSNRWNGWVYPVFEISVAKKLADALNNDEGVSDYNKITRDDENKRLIVEDFENEDTIYIEDTTIVVDGKEITVVGLMGGIWCWEAYFGEEGEQLLSDSQKALAAKEGAKDTTDASKDNPRT